MEGALIIPSEEDSHTFSINFSSGEVYKVRAAEARERQMWVDKLRASTSMSMVGRTASIRRNRTKRSTISTSSLCETVNSSSTTQGDAFNAVEDILMGLDETQQEVSTAIKSLPFLPNPADGLLPTPSCHSKDLLLLKATSTATVQCLETAFSFLQDISSRQTPSRIKNTGN